MKNLIKYSLFLFFLTLIFISNCKSQNKLRIYLSNEYDSLIIQKDHNIIIKELFELIESYKDTLFNFDIWYHNNLLDSGQNPFIKESPVSEGVSYYIKAYYWIWLIYVNSNKDQDIALLIFDDHTQIYDYEFILSNKNWILLYKRKEPIEKLRQSYLNWYIMFKKYGLSYLQQNNISPLPKEFKWIERKNYEWKQEDYKKWLKY